MARKRRVDGASLLHHVCNRGIASRPVFESAPDVAFFTERLARVAAEEGVELLAYCLLTTHFHLLLRTTDGSISRALRRVEQPYVQYFNRTRGRDGPLFKDRFFSRPLRSETDFRLVVRYIDQNPVAAGLAATPITYPHGSAWWYARRTGPAWLARATIEQVVCGNLPYDPRRYAGFFGREPTLAERELVERRMRSGYRGPDSLEDLIDVASPRVRRWLEERACLADRGRLREAVVSADRLLRHRDLHGDEWTVFVARRRRRAGSIAAAALLRLAAGFRFTEIAGRLGITVVRAHRWVGMHCRAMQEDPTYAERIACLLQDAVRDELGARAPAAGARLAGSLPSGSERAADVGDAGGESGCAGAEAKR